MGIFDVTDVAISVKSWYASYSEPAKKGCTPSKDTFTRINMGFLIPQGISFPTIYNMFSFLFDTRMDPIPCLDLVLRTGIPI